MSHPVGLSDGSHRRIGGVTAVPRDSLIVRAWWLSCIVVIHAAWGLYPVVARWLQTAPAEPLPALRLTFYINALACVSLAAFVSLPRLALQNRRGAGADEGADETKPIMAGNGGTTFETLQVCSERYLKPLQLSHARPSASWHSTEAQPLSSVLLVWSISW